MEAGEVRKRVRQVSLKIIREHVRTINATSGGWEDVVDEIRTLYGYDAWDVLFLLAATLRLHPHTGVPGAFRKQAADLKRRRRQAVKELKRFHARFMTGDKPLYKSLEVTETPHPAYDLVETRGKPSDWVLDEFAGHLGVILLDTRWAQARPVNPDADPFEFVFHYGRDLLHGAGGISISDQQLYRRYWRMKEAGILPPAPNDDAPEDFVKAVIQRTVGRLSSSERAVFLLSTALPLETVRSCLTANSTTVNILSSLSEHGDRDEIRQALGLKPLPPRKQNPVE